MGSEESDRQDARLVLHRRDQSIVISFDIEYDAPALKDRRFWMRRLDILQTAPLCLAGDSKPSVILRSRGLDSLVTGTFGETFVSDVRTDRNHEITVS